MSMADVLLTHSNHLYHDRKQVRKMQPYPPLQTLVAAACLRRQGYSVALFDSTFEDPESRLRARLGSSSAAMVAVCEDNFNFLTKMCLLRNRESAFRMAAECARCRSSGGRQRPRLRRPCGGVSAGRLPIRNRRAKWRNRLSTSRAICSMAHQLCL